MLSHVDATGNPTMVDVSEKKITRRTAHAQARVRLSKLILATFKDNELRTKKGPVFVTAIIAGVQGAKKTAELIPFCHPLGLDDCKVTILVKGTVVVIDSAVTVQGRTGVEMEALAAVTIAALTVYDMCKALSHEIVIEKIQLISKAGGKKDFKRR